MTGRPTRLALGVLLGVIGLVAMVRLVSGAFATGSPYVWVFVALPMLAWVGYAGWRTRRAQLAGPPLLAVALLVLVGIGTVWFGVWGPVLALACTLAGFVVIWVHDLPGRRPTLDHFVSVDDLRRDRDRG